MSSTKGPNKLLEAKHWHNLLRITALTSIYSMIGLVPYDGVIQTATMKQDRVAQEYV